jgi:hypothetical protein
MTKRTIFTTAFWLDSAERAIKSFAQACVLVWAQNYAPGALNVFDADLANMFGFAFSAAVLSFLTSVASSRTDGISPASLVPPGLD